jgi:hypothetical protein
MTDSFEATNSTPGTSAFKALAAVRVNGGVKVGHWAE